MGNTSEAISRIDNFRNHFGDDFVIDIQMTNRLDEVEYIKNVLPISNDKGIPLIATNDVLFSKQDDFDIHETKVCINTGKTLNDPNRQKRLWSRFISSFCFRNNYSRSNHSRTFI